MNEHAVTVSRLTVNCTVPRNHPNVERVRWRIEEVARTPLRQALEDVLAPLARSDSDEVVIIERLELDLDLDTSRDVSDLARRWAARLAARLVMRLEGSRGSVVRFPDRAHYLGRFLVDAAAGRAHGKWYYRRFRGLAPLATSAALRTALLEHPEQGVAALRSLAPAELVPVLEALGAREARRVLETLGSAAGNTEPELAIAAILGVAPSWHAFAPGLTSPWLAALALVALASGAPSPAPMPALSRLASAIAAWSFDPARQSRDLGEPPPELAPLAALAPARRAELAAALGKREPRAGEVGADPISEHTPFGGLLLLLPHVGALPIDDSFADPAARAWARLSVLARCAGAARAPRVLADPLLRGLCGVDDSEQTLPDTADFARALERRPDAAVRLAVGLDPHHGAVCIHLGDSDGAWLRLEPLSASSRAALRSGGDLRLSAARAHTATLLHLGGVDLAFTVAAQQVMRAFARRLPGFSESSPSYLYDNFLAFPAAVENRRICRMGRPPLAALLGFTGTLRGRIDVPWLGRLELYSGG